MVRYIDVSELKEWVENWFTMNRYYHPYAKNNNIPTTELYDILEQLPSADVRENVKGEWIEHNPHVNGLGSKFECSICGEELDCEGTNFCPNCGADMRGEQEGKQ